MTSTTIKVSRETRDLLRAHAQRHGGTMDDAITELLRDAARAERMEALRRAIRAMTPEQRASYDVESREWLNLPTYYAEQ